MRGLRRLLIGLAILGMLIGVGHWSGRQPDRDEVDAARRSLGIELTARRIDVGEVVLHTVLAGPEDGPPVVLLHGFPEFWYAWRGPMAVLARAGYRVIVPDQRGYNRSDKPRDVAEYRLDKLVGDIVGLVHALGYEKVNLAGHDRGGAVAWEVAIRHPEIVRRLVVLDTPHPRSFEDFESDEEVISWFRTFILIPWLPGYVSRVASWHLLATNLRATSQPGTFPDEHLDFFRSAWDRDGAIHSMGSWYRAAARFEESADGDRRVRLPTLLLVAPNDAFIPGDVTRRSMRFLDKGRMIELETGTHWVIQEEPERIGGILRDFFGEKLPDRETTTSRWLH